MFCALCWALKDERTASWTRDERPFEVSFAGSFVDAAVADLTTAFSLSSRTLKPRAGAGTLAETTTGCFEDAAGCLEAATAGCLMEAPDCLGAAAASCDFVVGFTKAVEDLAGTLAVATAEGFAAPVGG